MQEYRIGGLEIVPEKLKGYDIYESDHKFVVEHKDDVASLYVAQARSHNGVVVFFGLARPRIVGGGGLYIDDKNILVVGGRSGDFGKVPEDDLKKFGYLLLNELKKQGIGVKGINTSPF